MDLGFNVVTQWLIDHREEIIEEAQRWKMQPGEFVVEMLSDALDAWKNVSLPEVPAVESN